MVHPSVRPTLAFLVNVLTAHLALSGCEGTSSRHEVDSARTATQTSAPLTGAGATFPYPLYARWFSAYARETGIRINYQPVGSGAGIRQLLAGTVDFGATDVPMSDAELAEAPRGGVVHVPTVMGAVAIVYNLPGLADSLRLTGDVLADLLLGRITRWNDPRLAALNPRLLLQDRDVLVVHRADGSGTTYILSDFLSRANQAWASGPGVGKDLHWRTGFGAKGNEGIASQVKQLPGSIGYLEVVYARQNKLPVALLRNRAGNFVGPTPETILAAADSNARLDDPRSTLVDGNGQNAYPITAYTWIIFARNVLAVDRSREVQRFLRWALSDGEMVSVQLGYVPLPRRIAAQALASLDR